MCFSTRWWYEHDPACMTSCTTSKAFYFQCAPIVRGANMSAALGQRRKKKEHLTAGNWSVVYSAFTQSHLHGLSELNLSVRSSFQKLINSNTFNGSKDWPSSPFWHFWNRTSISVIAATLQLPSSSGGRQRFLWSRQQSRFLRMCLSK